MSVKLSSKYSRIGKICEILYIFHVWPWSNKLGTVPQLDLKYCFAIFVHKWSAQNFQNFYPEPIETRWACPSYCVIYNDKAGCHLLVTRHHHTVFLHRASVSDLTQPKVWILASPIIFHHLPRYWTQVVCLSALNANHYTRNQHASYCPFYTLL